MTKQSVYDRFQELLVESRRKTGLSQSDVALSLEKPQSYVSKYESGERRLDVPEFLELCRVLSVDPSDIFSKLSDETIRGGMILERWGISEEDLTDLLDANPSLRGILMGYVAEMKVHKILSANDMVEKIWKDDDHDRKNKADLRIIYRGKPFRIEVKSLQSNSVKELGGDVWTGKSQVDASDNREIELKNGEKLKTTCLLRGDFDLLAINCFAFGEKWRFAFILNSEIPQNTYRKYSPEQREQLLPTLVKVDLPLAKPFSENPFELLDSLLD